MFPCKASPLRRAWIPKPGKLEKRPLGIPTIKDRCLQALFKLALEPEWEARFEANAYGFRPGRNCHDAISAIRSYIQKRPKYVLDADIAKCFDRIDHEKLLDKIAMTGKYRAQLKRWLKSGVLDAGVFSETTVGTPQGGVISPLLANIALHGMEDFCRNLIKDIPTYGSTGVLIKPSRRMESLGFVRYADDFVVMHHDLNVILLIKEKLPEFLGNIGLELSLTKTRITHTLDLSATHLNLDGSPLDLGFNGKPGFNFLGFFIRQFKTFDSSAFGPSNIRLGFRTLIIPSKEACMIFQKKLHDIVLKQGKGLKQIILIKKLNPIIRGWANYFGKSDGNTMQVLGQMDYLLYLKLRQWSKRVYGTTGKGAQAFRKVGNNKWTFASEEVTLLRIIDYSLPLSNYVKVKGESSPFDGDKLYWSRRLTKNSSFNTRTTLLLNSQRGICPWCKTAFSNIDIMEVDHITPLSKGGKDVYANLQLLHGHCHDEKTRLD